MHIEYDKVRWPGYKDIIYRKRNQDHLPYDTRKIERILELGNDPSIWSKRSAREPNHKGLLFDSGFECGNIDQVRQRSHKEFDIWMRNDTNGGSNLQWFFFRVRNPENMTDTIRMNIVNFTKGNSLFYYGMKPSIWSLNANKKNQVGWI